MNKLDKLYFSALKSAAKEERTKSGGVRDTLRRSSIRFAAGRKFEKAIGKRPWPVKDDYEKEILAGMAKLAWSDFWAQREEEKGRSFSQQNIYDLSPKTPPAARRWAKAVAAELLRQEKKSSLTQIFKMLIDDWNYPNDPEQFGNDIAFEALGHGVSWRDRVKGNPPSSLVDVPHKEFYF